MSLSKKGIFKVRIRDKNEQEIPFIIAPTKMIYICVQPGTAFTVSLEKAGNDYTVYAPKLFIDGQEVYGFKTLPRKCNYHGFKMGGGMYKEFMFEEPPLIEQEHEKEVLAKRKEEFGTIKVQLYECVEYPASSKPKRKALYVRHQQLGREDSKKFFYRSVSVKEGDVFSIHKQDQSFLFMSGDPDASLVGSDGGPLKKKNSEYLGCFDEPPIDSCEIRYSSFIPLQIMGILHINNIDHLKCVPTNYLLEEQYLVQVIKTILENTDKYELEVDALSKVFRKWVRRDLTVCYELYNTFGDINTQLFQKYPEYFEITPDIKAVLRLKPGEFRTGKYPITFPKEYFDQECKSTATSSTAQSVSKMEDTEAIIIEDDEDYMEMIK